MYRPDADYMSGICGEFQCIYKFHQTNLKTTCYHINTHGEPKKPGPFLKVVNSCILRQIKEIHMPKKNANMIIALSVITKTFLILPQLNILCRIAVKPYHAEQ